MNSSVTSPNKTLDHRLAAKTATTTTVTAIPSSTDTTTTTTATSFDPDIDVDADAATTAATTSQSLSRSAASRSAASSSNTSARPSSTSYSPRVVFGAGAVSRLPTELGALRSSTPLIVSSPSRISLARRVQSLIPNLDSRILDSALVNVPQRVVDDVVTRISGRDSVISVGGASAMKLAKAIAARKKIPHICIPTTYSGSEMPLLGDSRRRKDRRHRSDSANGSVTSSKRSGSDTDGTLPTIIIYDEDLTNTGASMTISAPDESKAALELRCRRLSADEDAQWSYIHLPGV